ncbi:MAG TPA: hypothetical protein VEJ36_06295 [Nitrososphaerales archaeon]|nr:hypothetical protein [Nitrososphaerales archaeon]
MKAAVLSIFILIIIGGAFALAYVAPAMNNAPVRTFFPRFSTPGSVWWVGADSTAPSALPNTGAKGTMTVISTSITGCLAFWVADDLSDNMWGQVGYYICNSSTPTAFYQIWNLTSDTEITTGTTSVATGTHTFSMYSDSGDTWAYALDGTIFGTYDMGASSSSTTYPVYSLSEEEANSTFSFPEVTFSTAMMSEQSGSWGAVQTAVSYGTGWGVEGNDQLAAIPVNEFIVGGSLSVLSAGTTLWGSSSSSSTASSTTSSTTSLAPVTSTVTTTSTVTSTSTKTSTVTSTQTGPTTTVTSTTTSPSTTTKTSTVTTTQSYTSTSTTTMTSTVTSTQTGPTTTTTVTSTSSPTTTTTTKTSTTTTTLTSTGPTTTTTVTTTTGQSTVTQSVTETSTLTSTTTATDTTTSVSTLTTTSTIETSTAPTVTTTMTQTTSYPVTTTVTSVSTSTSPPSTSTMTQTTIVSEPTTETETVTTTHVLLETTTTATTTLPQTTVTVTSDGYRNGTITRQGPSSTETETVTVTVTVCVSSSTGQATNCQPPASSFPPPLVLPAETLLISLVGVAVALVAYRRGLFTRAPVE